ncbi:MAG: rod shape-determining protein, partial [Patescibacteria group bacterium]
EALSHTLSILIENIGSVVESTPPELVADIHQRGILLTGGGALLRGLPDLIQRETKIIVHVADDPLTAVVRGTGIVLEDLENLRHMLVLSTDSSSPGTKR